MYVEDLIQTHESHMHAASDSVSLYELCLVDLQGLVLLVSSIPCGSYTFKYIKRPSCRKSKRNMGCQLDIKSVNNFKRVMRMCGSQIWMNLKVNK